MQPPLSMISSCIQEGKFSVRLMQVHTSPMAPPCTVQVHLLTQNRSMGMTHKFLPTAYRCAVLTRIFFWED